MLDIFLENLKKFVQSRLLPIFAVFSIMFVLLIRQIFVIQIVDGQTYLEEATSKNYKEREVKSTRGNIYDRNGKLLAYNELSYSIMLEDSVEISAIAAKNNISVNKARNEMIYKLINIIEKHGGQMANSFAIAIDDNGEFIFTLEDMALLRFKRDAYGKTSITGKNGLTEEETNATAEEVFNFLRYGNNKVGSMYNIDEEFSDEEALKIMAIRFLIFSNWPKYSQITIATDINEELVAEIKECSAELPGVSVQQQTHRVYKNAKYFAHILGYTGLISDKQLEEFEEAGDNYYSNTDMIGKTGLEATYEEYLRGEKGSQKLSVNTSGRILEVIEDKEAIAGNNLKLTIDSDLQKMSYNILEKRLAEVLLGKINNGTDVGTKGTSATDIRIPIYDVYFALINNDIIDVKKFDDKDATELEKNVYAKFLSKQTDVLNRLSQILDVNSALTNKQLNEEEQEYVNYIYSSLKKNSIILKDYIDEDDLTLKKYVNGDIGLSEFLQYAISNNWIDLAKLSIGDQYYSTDEIYEILLNYIENMLKDDDIFNKKMYNYLVYSYKLSGKEICLLLFEQGVLKYNEEDINKLQNGIISAYSFIREKLSNLEIRPSDLALYPCTGAVVITDIRKGDVLALVSYPGYDINKLANKVDADYFQRLQTDLTYPMLNYALQSKSAPGSTFKPLSAIIALEEGVTTTTETVNDNGPFDKISPPPKCWIYPSAHGKVSVKTAITKSCNIFFYEMGYRLGLDSLGKYNSKLSIEKIQKYAKMFGFDDTSGIELSEVSPQIADDDAIRAAIGQDKNSYAPAQIARYVTTIANNGTCYDLTIIDKISNLDGDVILNNKANIHNNITLSHDEYWDVVHEGMYGVVNDQKGSVYNTFSNISKSIKIAGKTGTAQVNKSTPSHALFMSYAPYDNPKIAVTVVIQNGHTSSNAAAVARDIYAYYYGLIDKDEILNLNSNGVASGGSSD